MNEYLAEEILSDDKPLLHRFFSDDDESAIDKCLRGKRFLAVVMLHRVDTGTFIKEIR